MRSRMRHAQWVAVLVGMVGVPASAEAPPPVVGEVPKATPAPTPTPDPTPNPTPNPTSACDDVLGQALEELEFWKAQATGQPVLTVSTQTAASGGSALPSLPVIGPIVVPPRLTVSTPTAAAATPPEAAPVALPPVVYTGPRPRLEQAAAAVKEMKAPAAALVIAAWDDDFAAKVLAQLPARATGAIASALPPEQAARLLSRLSQLSMKDGSP